MPDLLKDMDLGRLVGSAQRFQYKSDSILSFRLGSGPICQQGHLIEPILVALNRAFSRVYL